MSKLETLKICRQRAKHSAILPLESCETHISPSAHNCTRVRADLDIKSKQAGSI